MANRIAIHQEIKELCKKLKDTNKLLAESNDLSVLDIDLLRKATIEIYDRINQLRLVMSERVELSESPAIDKSVEEKKEGPKAQEPEPEPKMEPVAEEVVSPQEEEKVEEEDAEVPVEIEANETSTTNSENIEEKAQSNTPNNQEETMPSDQDEEEPQDLASRFGSSPIKDLKREISIAKKFEFINSLFDGKMEVYAHSIHQMNGAGSGDEAFGILNELRQDFGWEEEDKNYMELANLIRRRYIS